MMGSTPLKQLADRPRLSSFAMVEQQLHATTPSKSPSIGGRVSGIEPPSPQIVANSDASRPAAEHVVPTSCSSTRGRDPWAVLVAISEKAKCRTQGAQIFLHDNEHVLGRVVKDPSFKFDSLNVSGRHCTIFRRSLSADENCRTAETGSGDNWLVYVKDSSSNGTFINGQRLKKDSPDARIKDGDIISLVNVPEHDNAFAFQYLETKKNLQIPTAYHYQPNVISSGALKRKSFHDGESNGEFTPSDNKRSKVLGIGGPDGPVSLDDVRRLQRSNEELRKQLEGHLLTIEKLRADLRGASARHDTEIKELKETLSAAFHSQIQDLHNELVKKDKELLNSTTLCTKLQNQIEDRDRSLAVVIQSRKDADEVIKSQKLNILELKEQLEDERGQRRNERERAATDLKAAVERVRSEACEELKRQSESSAQQLKEHLEMINKLQEADQENRLLIEALRSKLDATRETLVEAERASRTLESRLQEEEVSLATARKKIVEKEEELQLALRSMQNEKAAKEEALARLSSLEVEMENAIHDLSVEQQRLQGARERIVLRETQLRAFHSTAEEIAVLQQKQQEQLKEMMRVLEDGEEEVHVAVCEQFNGMKVASKVERDTETRREDTETRRDDNDATQKSDDSDDYATVNNEEKTSADDASSQTTGSGGEPTKVAVEICGDDDTQMDETVGVAHDSLLEKEQDGNRPVEVGYTQLLETEKNGHLLETQALGNVADESAQNKTFAGYTQLLDTQDKAGSVRHLINTELLSNEKRGGVSAGDGKLELRSSNIQGESPVKGSTQMENDVNIKNWNVMEEASSEARSSGDIGDANGNCSSKKLSSSIDLGRGKVITNEVVHQSRTSEKHVPLNTLDLMTSEVAGSWAYSASTSVHCENAVWSENHGRIDEINGNLETQHDFDASQVGDSMRTYNAARGIENSQSSLSGKGAKRDFSVLLNVAASYLHESGKVIETADSEGHTQEEEEEEDDEMHSDDSDDSKPLSQSVSVSARY